MHRTISYHLAQTRVADLRRHAQCDTLARAARGLGRHRCPGLRPCVPRAAQPGVAGGTSAR